MLLLFLVLLQAPVPARGFLDLAAFRYAFDGEIFASFLVCFDWLLGLFELIELVGSKPQHLVTH